MMRRRFAPLASAMMVALTVPAAALAQVPSTPEVPVQTAPRVGSKWWIVGGGGFSMARAGCVGGRISPRVDAGVEVMFVTARLDDLDQDPVRTTFIMGIAQFRPKVERGFYLRAGMGVGFAGNGLYSPFGPELAPPYSTNALGVTYGLGWIFRRDRRWTVQANFAHHIAALGELATVSGATVRNVVANYWSSGVAIAIR
jgi:hypothetical protein